MMFFIVFINLLISRCERVIYDDSTHNTIFKSGCIAIDKNNVPSDNGTYLMAHIFNENIPLGHRCLYGNT